MTYRVRLQWPGQRVTEKTTTESKAVADYAFCDLLSRYAGQDCAASMTRRDGKKQRADSLAYVDLSEAEPRTCRRCNYVGPFVDEGETCPNCKLVQ